jgi:hypothetical protein
MHDLDEYYLASSKTGTFGQHKLDNKVAFTSKSFYSQNVRLVWVLQHCIYVCACGSGSTMCLFVCFEETQGRGE